jgi:hypothetical protein
VQARWKKSTDALVSSTKAQDSDELAAEVKRRDKAEQEARRLAGRVTELEQCVAPLCCAWDVSLT